MESSVAVLLDIFHGKDPDMRRPIYSGFGGVARAFVGGLGAVLISGLLAGPVAAKQVKLSSETGQSVLIAGERQRTYVRINLEGIGLPDSESRAPVNIAIVIDQSGSMRGKKLARAKEAAIMALNRLESDDIVSVVTYNHNVNVIVPAQRLRDRGEIRARIRRFVADGRTALYAGVKQGIRELREYLDREQVNRVILLSDGLANVGPSTPEELGALGRTAAKKGISITTIGLGLGYNEDLMTKLAYSSDGNHAFVEHPDDLVRIFNEEFGDVLSVVAQDVEIIILCGPGIRPMRLIGREAKIDGRKVTLKLNQLYGAQEKYVVLEIDVPKNARADKVKLADVSVNYKDMRSKTRESLTSTVEVRFSTSEKEAKASLNKRVMTAVVNQIAIERNEKAVKLRDKGKISEAKKVLELNATYLDKEASRLDSQELKSLGKKNLDDARSLSPGAWSKTRKAMRARQYKGKTQQAY
ncbi:hypothetical protein MnTg02_00549 [bacterium MnTg02]|nr:hypothetical protein MnTg02_00549 [bacterium MnTg02]